MAILPWGHVIEDFIDPEGLSLDAFADEFRGSWMFGYADALATAGVRTAVVAFSARAPAPVRRPHLPTGATLSLLPAPAPFRALRARAGNLYARTAAEAFPRATADGPLGRAVRAVAREAAPYLATPPIPLARELRELGADALLSQEYESPQFDMAVAAGALARIPVAASFQGGDYQRYGAERLTRPATIRRAHRLIVPTAREAARVRERYGVAEERFARIFNPVDTSVWRPRPGPGARAALGIPEEAPLVAWHGRVSLGQKGLDVLLAAWQRLEEGWSGAQRPRLLMVGDGRDSEAVDRLAAGHGLEGLVRVRRLVHDPDELAGLLSAADLYALPSRHEGFPVALLEALACGLPAVAADANGVTDILGEDDGAGGIVVPREDAGALAEALASLLSDAGRLTTMASAARASAEARFSNEAIGRALREALLPQAAAAR